jgi:hypothetical protein
MEFIHGWRFYRSSFSSFTPGAVITVIHKKHIRLVALKQNKDLVYMNELFEAGKMRPVIDGPYRLDQVPEAFRIFGKGEHKGKMVITVLEELSNDSLKLKIITYERAAVRTKYGLPGDLSIKELDIPTPKDDEVLIRVHATTANRSDCHVLSGKPFFMRLFTGLFKPGHRSSVQISQEKLQQQVRRCNHSKLVIRSWDSAEHSLAVLMLNIFCCLNRKQQR